MKVKMNINTWYQSIRPACIYSLSLDDNYCKHQLNISPGRECKFQFCPVRMMLDNEGHIPCLLPPPVNDKFKNYRVIKVYAHGKASHSPATNKSSMAVMQDILDHNDMASIQKVEIHLKKGK